MQNLTSRYNILHNANILLEESVRNMEAANQDDYSQLISVYKEPDEAAAQAISSDLDSVIGKGKNIVEDKLYSHYVDDAYFLIAKANYYKARFFSAAEFFTYVYNSYPDEAELRLQALTYQARSLIQLDKLQEARESLDSALKHIDDSKKTMKHGADVYATRAQYLIKTGKEAEAIGMLQKALDAKGVKRNKLRWTYVLAQLQDRNQQYAEAYKNYTSIVKSNAPFNMAFNAGLNRIAIEDARSGEQVDKVARLKSLLKDEKNRNFIDQIYYRIGDVYLSRNQTNEAIKNYNTAIRLSAANQNQKGLSYLRIADIYFKNGDYVSAKSYYDSTLTALSPSFKGYDLIRRKANNLQLLASRFRIIGREDTLQILARLPEGEREARIGALVREQTEKTQFLSNNNSAPETMVAALDRPEIAGTAQEGKFYFNNTSAISQGLTDFKRRWGNRSLEDNWRRSSKTAAEQITSVMGDPDASPSNSSSAANPASVTPATPEAIRNSYVGSLPLTEPALQLSNQRIADAYYDIASFYRDELKDNAEAIKTFEELLKRVPESNYKLSIYYNLYRLYSDNNQQKSEEYKNLLLTKYPESPFAKVIADPDYSRKTSEKEFALNEAYNKVYALYLEKKYQETQLNIAKTEAEFGKSVLSPQLSYLNALTIGHQQRLPEFEQALKSLVNAYPDDKLITPLVKQHLSYIDNNRILFAKRPTALTDFNPFEPVVIEPSTQQAAVVSNNPAPVNAPAATTIKSAPVKVIEAKPMTEPAPAVKENSTAQPSAKPVVTTPPVKVLNAKPLYDLPLVAEYYFTIHVTDPAANLSSSRFGIGQFNRSNFSDQLIKHQLKLVNNEVQLIFVGPFDNRDAVKAYERGILPLIKDIMKVPAEKYNTFVITKTELERLTDNSKINAYLDFYKNSSR